MKTLSLERSLLFLLLQILQSNHSLSLGLCMPDSEKQEKDQENKQKELLIKQQIAFASGMFEGDLTIRTLLESLAEGVVIIDKTGTILLVNARAERMFGYSKTEMIGKHHDIILPWRFHQIHVQHMRDYFREPKIRPMGMGLDLLGLRSDGREIPVEISLSYIETADNFFIVSFISDITFRKQAEQALQDRNQALDAFAHTLAHDIKNSIAVITGFSTFLYQDLDELTREEILDSTRRISETGNKINHIIDGLLLFSTISREEVSLMPVDMVSIVKSVLERLDGIIERSGAVVLVPESFPAALGFSDWVEEIWFNYISNAVKYGGDPPVIELGASVREDANITFWVKDNGPGLKPEQIDTIFVSYESRKEKSKKGFGLGLSIVKRIAEKLNGQVGVKNASGGGSIFTFTLPAVGSHDKALKR